MAIYFYIAFLSSSASLCHLFPNRMTSSFERQCVSHDKYSYLNFTIREILHPHMHTYSVISFTYCVLISLCNNYWGCAIWPSKKWIAPFTMFIPINMTCTTKTMFLYCYVDILIMGKILNQLTHTASLSAPKMDIYNLNYKYLLCMNISTFVKEIYNWIRL